MGCKLYACHAQSIQSAGEGGQEKDVLYIPAPVEKNDGKIAYTITVPKDVPVGGFWSVTIYNQDRFMVKNEFVAYSFNSITAKRANDGTATLHLGGDSKAENYRPIMGVWLYVVRFYQPEESLLNGTWKFPEAIAAR